MNQPIRILIADDHPIVREGVRTLLATEPDMVCVGEANDGAGAIQLYGKLRPDVVLMDLMMPNVDGITAIREIKRMDKHSHILVLTSFMQHEKLFPALKAGALGYLLKDTTPDELVRAIRRVARGESSLHPAVARKVIQELHEPSTDPAPEQLSEREVQVLGLIADGLSNQAIADRLTISERTVRNHVGNILAKLHLANRTQAALYALRQGPTPPEANPST